MRSITLCSVLLLCACGASNAGTKTNVEGSGGESIGSPGGTDSGPPGGGTANGGTGNLGNANAGSTASVGGSAPVIPPVKTCAELPAPGMWENVTPPRVNENKTFTGALMPIVDPKTSAVYVMTDGNGVFRSSDCGSSWEKVNTGRNAANLDSGRIWAAIMDRANPETLYAITGYGAGGLWKTTNGGIDWDQAMPEKSEVFTTAGAFLERVTMNPEDSNHLLINFHNNCSAPHTPVCFGETKDGGATWSLLDFPPDLSGGWGEGSGIVMLSSKVWLYEQGALFRTTDAGKNWTKVPEFGGWPCFPGDARITQTPDGALYLGVTQGVARSMDNGATWQVLPNSGGHICSVIGDGNRLFALTSDHPQRVFAASYSDVMTWTKLDTPGLSEDLSGQFMYVADYDAKHHVLYGAAQASGVFRVVTQ